MKVEESSNLHGWDDWRTTLQANGIWINPFVVQNVWLEVAVIDAGSLTCAEPLELQASNSFVNDEKLRLLKTEVQVWLYIRSCSN